MRLLQHTILACIAMLGVSACSTPSTGLAKPTAVTPSVTPSVAWSADPASPSTKTSTAPHADGRTLIVPFAAACPYFSGEEMFRLTDSSKPVEAQEQPRKLGAGVTHMCKYEQEGAGGAYGAISVVYYPDDGHKLEVGKTNVLKNKTNIKHLDRDGDLAAIYQNTKASQRGIVFLRKVGPDAIMFLLDVDTTIPDVVTERLPAVIDTIASRLPPKR